MARESSLACVRAGAAPCGTAGLRCALRESDVACAHLTTIVRPAERRVPTSVCVPCACVSSSASRARLTPN
jgi:hypothetical protein